MNISSVATGGRRGLAQLTLIAMLLVLCAGLEPTQVYAQIYGEEDSNCPARHGNPDSTAPPSSFPWLNNALAPDQRVELLLAQMTLEEKVDLVTGDSCGLYGFFNAPIPRLHIPALTMTDGPAGVRVANPATNNGKATAMPAPIALAATWDITQASTYGGILGSEAFLTGHNVLLGPAIDLASRKARPWAAHR
jgi:beta-glucosidase